jgi:hypothetical protein
MNVFGIRFNSGLLLAQNGGVTNDETKAWMTEDYSHAKQYFQYKKERNQEIKEVVTLEIED